MEGARDETNLRRSDLSIHRITSTLQQQNTEPPNCQTNWLRYLDPNKPIDWKAVWQSIGTPFTNPKDEHTWLIGILHRHLYVRSKQSEENQTCRLCKRSKETISHITQDCTKIIAVKSKISELLRKMGLKTSAIDGIRTWVFGFDKEKQLLSQPIRALTRIMWRTIYIHMTKQEKEKRTFRVKKVVQEIHRRFMSRILAFQKHKSDFHVLRTNTKLQSILPARAATAVLDLGILNCTTGRLDIHQEIIDILKKSMFWRDFNI